MANRDREFISDDVVEQQHAVHSRALGQPSQSGRAEATRFGSTTDATLSWGGGQPVAVQGREDFPLSKELTACAGVSPVHRTASQPEEFQKIETLRNQRSGCSGLDEIDKFTKISDFTGGRK